MKEQHVYTMEDWQKALVLGEKLYNIANKWSSNVPVKVLAFYINVVLAEKNGIKINIDLVRKQLEDFEKQAK